MSIRLPSRALAPAFAVLLMVADPAAAQAGRLADTPSESIRVPKNTSVAFRLDAPAGKVVVAQPDIADIVATTDQSFLRARQGHRLNQPAGL